MLDDNGDPEGQVLTGETEDRSSGSASDVIVFAVADNIAKYESSLFDSIPVETRENSKPAPPPSPIPSDSSDQDNRLQYGRD